MANQRAEDAFKANFWTTRELWALFGNVAAVDGTDRTKDLINFMRWRTGDPAATLPAPASRTGDGTAPDARRSIDHYIARRREELDQLRDAAHAALARGVDVNDILDHVEEAGREISAAGLHVAKLEASGHPEADRA